MHKLINKIFTIIPLLGVLTGCSNDPSPANQRKFNPETEYNSLDDVAYYGEGQGRNCPTTGNVNIFVVPVEFTDFPADEIGMYYNCEEIGRGSSARALKHVEDAAPHGRGKENAKEDIRKVYFGEKSETQWHSLRSYYLESSYGRLNFGGLVADWYQVYTDFETQEPVSAVQWAKSSSAASLAAFILADYTDETTKKYREFKNEDGSYMFDSAKKFLQYFDSNDDGYFDLLEIVYSAPYHAPKFDASGKDSPIDNDKFWAYCGGAGSYGTGRVDAPVLNKYAFQSYYTFVEGGTWRMSDDGTHEIWREWTCEEIATGITKVDAHTVTHETGHGLGLPDYYDYDYQQNPAGIVDMMDNNIGDHNSHSKSLYGWVEPIIVTGPTQVTIRSFTETGDCIYVPYRGYFNDHKHQGGGDTFNTEYLAIELYTPTGLNKEDSERKYAGRYALCPSEPGVKIYHVDSRLANKVYNSRTGIWEIGAYTDTLTHGTYSTTQVATSNTGSRRVEDFWELQYLNSNSESPVSLVSNQSLWHEGDALNDGKNYVDFCMNEYYPTSNPDEEKEHIPFGYKITIDSVSAESATITFYAA